MFEKRAQAPSQPGEEEKWDEDPPAKTEPKHN